ncbi:MAG: hypothetical protein AAGK23_07110 [Pseudomonadota bacterium]
MEFIDRVWTELVEEMSYVAEHLQDWWNRMDVGEQMFALGVVCAACLLLGLRQPVQREGSLGTYHQGETAQTIKQFLFAGVVLLVFTFGADIAVESLK